MIYLDNAATTFPGKSALDAFLSEARLGANPSSLHRAGFDAHTRLESARKTLAMTLHASADEVIFTSGGTESANLALFGAALARKRLGNTILSSDAEHPCVLETIRALTELFCFRHVQISAKGGKLDTNALYDAAQSGDIVLAAFMRTNNETGAIYDVKSAFSILRSKNPNVFCFSDCVQAYLKEDLSLSLLGADAIGISAHKIHALRGAGALIRNRKLRLIPHSYGGGQEGGLRSGTENSPAIAAFAAAAKEGFTALPESAAKMREMTNRLIAGLEQIEGASVLAVPERVCHIVSAAFPGQKSEVLLHRLSDAGICVSSGSACSSGKAGKNRVLQNYGLESAKADATLRFSVSAQNTAEEIDRTLTVLQTLLRI